VKGALSLHMKTLQVVKPLNPNYEIDFHIQKLQQAISTSEIQEIISTN